MGGRGIKSFHAVFITVAGAYRRSRSCARLTSGAWRHNARRRSGRNNKSVSNKLVFAKSSARLRADTGVAAGAITMYNNNLFFYSFVRPRFSVFHKLVVGTRIPQSAIIQFLSSQNLERHRR